MPLLVWYSQILHIVVNVLTCQGSIFVEKRLLLNEEWWIKNYGTGGIFSSRTFCLKVVSEVEIVSFSFWYVTRSFGWPHCFLEALLLSKICYAAFISGADPMVNYSILLDSMLKQKCATRCLKILFMQMTYICLATPRSIWKF